jgi:dolichol-phosphate mannosyltransferase
MVEKNILGKWLNKTFLKNKKFLRFGIVGTFGTIINTVLLWVFSSVVGMYYLIAAVIATEIAIVSNFIGNHVFTFRNNNDPSPLYSKFAKFQFISLATIFGTIGLLWIFISIFGLKYLLVWNLISILIIFLMNFELNKRFTWKEKSVERKTKYLRNFLFLFIFLFFVGFASSQDNATLNVYSNPEGAFVFIDDIDYGISPLENVSFVPGNYSILLSLSGYENETGSFELFENETLDLNFDLVALEMNETENETENGIFIIANSTNLVKKNGSYFMYEIESGEFSVTLNSGGEIEWFLDDEFLDNTNGTVHLFEWVPGILSSSSASEIRIIKAKTTDDEVSWEIDFRDVINPFFNESSGSSGAMINIFIRHNVAGFDDIENVSIVISSKQNGLDVSRVYHLESENAGGVTKWFSFISNDDFFVGGNFLSEIILISSDKTESYFIPIVGDEVRGFNKIIPEVSPSGSGGGASSGKIRDNVELIYVILDKNILYENETQTITLDAKAKNEVRSVGAIFKDSSGIYFGVNLDLVSGKKNYGTWQKKLDSLAPGSYDLVYVDLIGYDRESYVREIIKDRSFYVLSEEVIFSEKLGLVYSVLGESVVGNAGNVSFKLDARDFEGITNASAVVKRSRGEINENFEIPLFLVSGDKKYGTWEGFIYIDEPDMTFSVVSVILFSEEDSKEYQIKGRSVYANSLVEDLRKRSSEGSFGFFTGLSVFNLEKLRDNPRSLVVIGFVLFSLITFIYFLFYIIKEMKTPKGEKNGL